MKSILYFLLIIISVKSYSQEKDLDFYINKSQKNSPLLTDLSNQIKSNKIDSLINVATYKTQVSGSLNGYYAPTSNGYGYDFSVTNGQTVTGLIGVNKKIIGKGIINSQAQSFQLLKESLQLNKSIATQDINKVVISQYITASASLEQCDYNQKMLGLLKNTLLTLKKLTQNSTYKQTDYLLFLSTLKQQELQVVQLEQQYQNELNLLNYLSGETDTNYVSLKKPKLVLKNFQEEQSTIFLKQFKIDSLKIENQNQLIDNAYKPSLSLLGDAGYLSSYAYQGYKNFGFSVGLGLSIPIYDGNQRSLQHQKNETALATNLAYKNNFKRQYHQQIEMLKQKLKQTESTQNQLQSQLLVADALIEADKKLLLSGDALITDFVIAIGNVISINNAISLNKIKKLQIINEINYWCSND